MDKDFEYLADQSILIHHIAKHSIFDEVSYLLVLKEMIAKIQETKPTRLLLLVKTKQLFKYDEKFGHWIEKQVFQAFLDSNITKVAFVVNFNYKPHGAPDFSGIPEFSYHFFHEIESAREWLNDK